MIMKVVPLFYKWSMAWLWSTTARILHWWPETAGVVINSLKVAERSEMELPSHGSRRELRRVPNEIHVIYPWWQRTECGWTRFILRIL